jgi:hypothetical protein
MISVFDIAVLAVFAWAGHRMWSKTSSMTARAVSLASLGLLALRILGP